MLRSIILISFPKGSIRGHIWFRWSLCNYQALAKLEISHLDIYKSPSKSSISYLNQTRSYEVFQDLYFELLRKLEPRLEKARQYEHKKKQHIFIVDSPIIPLSLSLFGWVKFQTINRGIKLLEVLDYDIVLPNFEDISDTKKHDLKVVKVITFPYGSYVVADKA